MDAICSKNTIDGHPLEGTFPTKGGPQTGPKEVNPRLSKPPSLFPSHPLTQNKSMASRQQSQGPLPPLTPRWAPPPPKKYSCRPQTSLGCSKPSRFVQEWVCPRDKCRGLDAGKFSKQTRPPHYGPNVQEPVGCEGAGNWSQQTLRSVLLTDGTANDIPEEIPMPGCCPSGRGVQSNGRG